jgi:peptidyl-prolyl cis-trans isomerase D
VLDLMRRHAQSWIIKVALGGIIIVFIFWYGWSGPSDKSQSFAAKVNGTNIPYDQFYNVYESEIEKMRLRFKGSIPADLLDKVNLKKTVVQGLVQQLLLVQEASKLGLFVTDEDLIQDMRSNPIFSRNGSFDRSLYQAYLSSIKLTTTAYEESRKQELLELQLARLLTDAVKTDPMELRQLWHFHNDKLVLSVLKVPIEEQQKGAEIDSKAIEAFYNRNSAKYEIPPSVNLEYVVFSWKDLMKSVQVSEEEAKDYFTMHPKEFEIPERIRVRNILLKVPGNSDEAAKNAVMEKAAKVLARIKSGEDFSSIAMAESEDTSSSGKGGDLGYFSKGTLSPDLEKGVSKLEPGQVSEPIPSEDGYQILKLEDRQVEKVKPFEEVKQDITEKLRESRAHRQVIDESDQFYEQVYRTEDLEKQTEKHGFEIKRQDFVIKGSSLDGIGSDSAITDEIFQLKTNDISKLLRSGDNYIVVKLLAKNKERLPPLDEIRGRVEKDFLREQGIISARQKADDIIKLLEKNPGDPDSVTRGTALTWQQLEPVSRTSTFVKILGSSPQVPEMLTSISEESPVFPSYISTPDGIAVVMLHSIDKASEESYLKDRQAFENWIVEVRKTEFFKGWVRLLEDRSKIEINEKLL